MGIEKLQVLETRVEQILNQHASLTAERDRLFEQLQRAEARFQEISSKLEQYEKERTEIKARVERILGRLEGIGLGPELEG